MAVVHAGRLRGFHGQVNTTNSLAIDSAVPTPVTDDPLPDYVLDVVNS